MRIFYYLLVLCVLCLGVTFALLNHQTVALNYYFGQAHMPVSILVVSSFVLGGVLGCLVSFALWLKLRVGYFVLKRRYKALDEKYHKQQALPTSE